MLVIKACLSAYMTTHMLRHRRAIWVGTCCAKGEHVIAIVTTITRRQVAQYESHYLQNICLPIVLYCGRVQIHLDVAVSGLK